MSEQLLLLGEGKVLPEWIDYNQHMNVAYYVLAFDHATDALLAHLGMDAEYPTREGGSSFALEMHVTYDRELQCDEPYLIYTQLLDADSKRLHFFHQMIHATEGWLAATNEVITMHVGMAERRAAPFPPGVQQQVDQLLAAHHNLPRPDKAGRVIGIRRKSE
ncbi:thioesterase family protein [Nitrincola sp. MINF-07-Sa-05]|uniref:thioesterase family protein n=1 Tax=Nitrincola salilacus TaxID=3400273 RepID=UPI00391838C5